MIINVSGIYKEWNKNKIKNIKFPFLILNIKNGNFIQEEET